MGLFMPTKIQKDNIFGEGIGKKEVKKISFSVLIGGVLGICIGIIFFRANSQMFIFSVVLSAGIIGMIAFFTYKKMSTNFCIADYLRFMLSFIKFQKMYKYNRLKEWC